MLYLREGDSRKSTPLLLYLRQSNVLVAFEKCVCTFKFNIEIQIGK